MGSVMTISNRLLAACLCLAALSTTSRFAIAEIACGKDAPIQRKADENRLAYELKLTVDAYKAQGHHDSKWDERAIHFLTQAPRRLAKLPDAPSLVDLEREGRL